MPTHKWPPPSNKNKEVVLCPKCLQPGGVQLFTSISPCDKCLNPDEFQTHAYKDTEPFGAFTLSNAKPWLPLGAVALGTILGVTNSSYGPMAAVLSLPASLDITKLTYKLTTTSLVPSHAPLIAYSQLPDYSWAVHVAGVASVLSKISVGEVLYAIP